MAYQTIEVKKLTPYIGAEIGGVPVSCCFHLDRGHKS
jgi:hypothetical protein